MPQFFNSISEVAKNYKSYDDWEQEQDNVFARKEHLIKQKPLDKFEKEALAKKAENIVRVSELMDARSEDNAQDTETITSFIAGIGTLGTTFLLQKGLGKYLKKNADALEKKGAKTLLKNAAIMQLGVIFGGLAVGIGFILWGTSKTKEASRLGRFQAKIHELKDEKSFVQFTPEQIAEAEKIAAKLPDEKERRGLLKAIHNVKQMHKDSGAYEQYKKHKKKTTAPKMQLSKEQMEQAQQDKELLLNVIKKVNNTAEDYSENVENAFDTINAVSFLSTIPIGFGLNKLFKAMKLKIPRTGVAMGVSAIFPVVTSIWSLIAEKKAARVGRYIAKQEILKNPELLRKFSDEDMKSVSNIKAPKRNRGFFKKIGENLSFIGQYLKDSKKYSNYIKKERPQKEKLNKALLQVKVSDAQLQEGKHLQEKTFMSFDKIDEMSQRYSEDMEAAGEIGKNIVSTGATLAGFGALIGTGALFVMGKFPTHKILKFISKVTFKKTAPVRQVTDEFYQIINKNKELKRAFNRLLSPADGKDAAIRTLFENPEIQQALMKRGLSTAITSPAGELLGVIQEDYGVRKAFFDLFSSSQTNKQYAMSSILYNKELAEVLSKHGVTKPVSELFEIVKSDYKLKDALFAIISGAKGAERQKAINTLISKPEIQKLFRDNHQLLLSKAPKPVTELFNVIKEEKSVNEALLKMFEPGADTDALLATLFSNPKIRQVLETNREYFLSIIQKLKNPQEFILQTMKGWCSGIPAQLNDNFFARWGRNLLAEIGVLKVKSLAPYSMEAEIAKEADKFLEKATGRKIKNNYSRYKTLINTSIVAGVPILGTIVGIPYAICSWLTNLQKKAGRIGVMKAIKDLDDPNLFVNTNSKSASPQTTAQNEQQKLAQRFLIQNKAQG